MRLVIRIPVRKSVREERNRLSGIATHTARITECEANLEEAIVWEREHPDALLKNVGTHIWSSELAHSRAMLAMYQNKGHYSTCRRRGSLIA